MEKLWTTAEVAECLGITEEQVNALVTAGRLTGYKLGGQFLRFRPDQVKPLKGTVGVVSEGASAAPREGMFGAIRDFVYFYDFYLVSAGLLAVAVVYLIVVD